MEYREEIDGLRAIAVIPVILFHAGFEYFSGGFVGVDVFFVISGYLITNIILFEKEKGTFALVDFYERRARRIIPALFLVMLVSSIFSWFWLSPSHMQDYSQSLVAVSVFLSNILFWKETGYWGIENELKPLLHTWSLAVEEQYYILFPLFLILMWRFSKRWILGSFLLVALGSLALSHWAAFNHASANFFLLATRAWELAIGAGIAFYFLYRKQTMRSLLSHRAIDEIASWAGICLISYAVFNFDSNTPFPSLYALVPTIGTALIIIFSSANVSISKFLGSRILVRIGLISYSAYLWHYPVFVFARHRSLQEPSPIIFILLSIISLFIAFISWKYVEAPFRKRKIISRKQIFLFTLCGSLVFIFFGLLGHYTSGYKFRIDNELAVIVNKAEKRSFDDNLCVHEVINHSQDSNYCLLVPNKEKSALLYGDSHAQALMFEAKKAFLNTDYGLLSAATSACPPVKNTYRADNHGQKNCYEHNNEVYNYIISNPQIIYVILSARWSLHMEGVRFDNKEGGVEHGRNPHLDVVNNQKYLFHENYNHRDLIAQAYINTVQILLDAGKKVILIYPVPEAGWNVPDYISRFYWVDHTLAFDEYTASTSYTVFSERNKRTIEALDKIPANKNLFRIYPDKIFCNNAILDRCITQKDGDILYRDDDHLSDSGAALIIEKVINHLH